MSSNATGTLPVIESTEGLQQHHCQAQKHASHQVLEECGCWMTQQPLVGISTIPARCMNALRNEQNCYTLATTTESSQLRCTKVSNQRRCADVHTCTIKLHVLGRLPFSLLISRTRDSNRRSTKKLFLILVPRPLHIQRGVCLAH